MTNEEILEKQVEALEKLLQIKEAIIKEHESKISQLEMERLYNPQPFIGRPYSAPSVFTADPCSDGGHHDYAYPWFSTSPQPCKKCSKVSPHQWTISSSNTVILEDDNRNIKNK